MRLVRYEAQQRVDHPDIQAMSALILGEFRRTIRGMMLGPGAIPPEHDNYVIRGFKVEPDPTPDSTVLVKIDPGGSNPLGFAIGAEDLSSRVDHGQLMGGDDSNGNIEGNATLTYDFSGDPAATYTLSMRFTYSDSVNDNRAFWNAGTNSEFIAATDTREVPAIELGVGMSGDEWIPLAEVVWDGASIDAGDITDKRVFAHEGAAPYDRSTQDGSGAMEDFSRSGDRAANGLNEIYPVLRALARQVQDLKGPDASGNFNWYGRVFRPFDDTNSTLPAEQTKTLRTVDTVTYTIGDGVSTFGDFNGADGLEDCLQHLEDLGSQRPQSATIKLRTTSSSAFTWNINTDHTLVDTHIELDGRDGGSDLTGSGRARLNLDSVPGSTALRVNASANATGSLTVYNVEVASEPANNIAIFGCSGALKLVNCRLYGRVSDGASSVQVVDSSYNGCDIRQCEFQGWVKINGDNVDPREGGIIEQCAFHTGAILFDEGASERVKNFTIRSCEIRMDDSSGFGLRGVIDAAGILNLTVSNCSIGFIGDVDAIHVETRNFTPEHVVVSGCNFFEEAAPSHTVGNGGNGSLGTGWCVYFDGNSGSRLNNLVVENCQMRSYADCVDAGGIRVNEAFDARISHCDWSLNGHKDTEGTETYTAISVLGSGGSGAARNMQVAITGCTMGSWSGTANDRTRGIHVEDANDLVIQGCNIRGDNNVGTSITGRGANDVALLLENSDRVRVMGCEFALWERDVASQRCITVSSCAQLVVNGCVFQDNGGYCLSDGGSGTSGWSVCANTVLVSDATGNGKGFLVGEACVVCNNAFDFGANADAIAFGAISTAGAVCMGNWSNNGDIQASGTTSNLRGYNEAGDLNFVNAYV